MADIIETLLALKERLEREKGLPLQSIQLTPVDPKELRRLEDALGPVIPPAYLQFITRHGLFSATDAHGQERARMLSPSEVLEEHTWQKECIEEGVFGDEEDELEASRQEAKVRSRLVPFQYVTHYVRDFYVFDMGLRRDTGPLIFAAHHDDFDLAPWLLDEAPDVSGCTFDFDEHLRWVLRECMEGGRWGR
ncbi:SMI1/KNR4 family protein [Pyxidicoccus parkwayensis]|uniref:SMI1/KNR4 family protein n=1 Tax=Pyxidicoccus parkwayensis TaxID=2813578 RepID=A0ABX7NVB0_9BACT|nr:SMI1/KNR4 family protein [Pyxidicoccus parkwaysis]QSQ22341.1 SMI1/KNR4 family protein [Pyxidicoccus parkwaysis]